MKTLYQSFDGQFFNSEKECKAFERESVKAFLSGCHTTTALQLGILDVPNQDAYIFRVDSRMTLDMLSTEYRVDNLSVGDIAIILEGCDGWVMTLASVKEDLMLALIAVEHFEEIL